MRPLPFILFLSWLIGGFGGMLAAEEFAGRSLVISRSESIASSLVAEAILKRAYQRLGVAISFRTTPSRRSLAEAEKGHTDGETARLVVIESDNPNLIRVDVPIDEMTLRVFSIRYDPDVWIWSDLKFYHVGILRGWVIVENHTARQKRTLAPSSEQLMRLLSRNRVDLVIERDIDGILAARTHFPAAGIRIVGQPLLTAPMYHYLHRDNADLVKPIEAVLREMSVSDEIRTIQVEMRQKLTTAALAEE